VLTRLTEALQIATELHLQFTRAADAANRAGMASSDDGAAAARLAVENTNLKAQRLAFDPGREAAVTFRRSLEAAGTLAGAASSRAVNALAHANIAVLDIQVLYGPHIWESEDAAMTQMEQQMAASEATARQAMAPLKMLLPSAAADLEAAAAALDRFSGITREIVTLSRQNTNVRSVALSLGQKRALSVKCDDQLRALEEALDKHAFTATR
jgi:hypothetical protein